jgi:predicted dehydrogenase
VLCEKPISDNVADGLRMRDAAAASGRILNIGFMLHFHPGLLRLRELIQDGTLGTIGHIHCRVGSYITLVNSTSRHQAKVEGALLLDYTHQPDLLAWFLGKRPAGVYMSGGQAGKMDFSSTPNFATLVCDYDEPLLATVHLNYLQMPERVEYEVVGDKGWAVYDYNTGLIRRGRREEQDVAEEKISVERDPVYEAEHQAFFDAIDGRRNPESPADSALVSLEIVEAALESWRKQQRVALR